MSRHPTPVSWERVLERCEPEPMSGCWIWLGTVGHGYGVITVMSGGRSTYYGTHRLAWIFNRGPIPPGLDVCHKCDVRRCVNPNHLFLGTRADNIRDMYAKGRDLHSKRPAHVCSERCEIARRGLEAGKTHLEMAADMGLSQFPDWLRERHPEWPWITQKERLRQLNERRYGRTFA